MGSGTTITTTPRARRSSLLEGNLNDDARHMAWRTVASRMDNSRCSSICPYLAIPTEQENEIMKAGKKQAKRLERRQRQYDAGHKSNERRPGSNKK